METFIHYLDEENPHMEVLEEAAALIREGKTVVFPTETVYGLGANALLKKSVSNIFRAKGRPLDNPLIVHISSYDMLLYCIGEPLSDKARKLIAYFWPGPLTIIFKKSRYVSDDVTAGLPTVAIRMPENKIALELIKRSGVPIAAPSANISGKPSPTSPDHVINDMNGKVDMILCSSDTVVGLESTVIDISGDIPVILRPGGITREALEKVLGEVRVDSETVNEGSIPRSPGMKYTHYAPEAKMFVLRGERNKIIKRIREYAEKDKAQGLKVGILTVDENKDCYKDFMVISMGDRGNTGDAAYNLFRALREFDNQNVDKIYAEAIGEEYFGLAVMNRMKKAAGFNIIEV